MDSTHSISFQLLPFRNKRSQLFLMQRSPSTHISHSTAYVSFSSSLCWCEGQPRARRCPGSSTEKTPKNTHRNIFSSLVKHFSIPALSHKNSQPWSLWFFQVGPAGSIYKLLWWGGKRHQLSVCVFPDCGNAGEKNKEFERGEDPDLSFCELPTVQPKVLAGYFELHPVSQ